MNPINYEGNDDVQPANSLVKGELFIISKYNYDNCAKLSDATHRD